MIQLKYCNLLVPIPSIHVNVTSDFLFLLQKFPQAFCLTADILTCEITGQATVHLNGTKPSSMLFIPPVKQDSFN